MAIVQTEAYWKEQEQKLIEKLNNIDLSSSTTRIYCLGDCYTYGTGIKSWMNYPNKLQYELGKNYEVYNLGRTMITMATILEYNNLFSKITEDKNSIVILWAGTNDIALKDDVNMVYHYFSSYCKKLKEHDIITIGITMLPRIIKELNIEPLRILFNRVIYENRKEYADYILDVSKITEIGIEQTPKYYLMYETHLNEEGYEFIYNPLANLIKIMNYKMW